MRIRRLFQSNIGLSTKNKSKIKRDIHPTQSCQLLPNAINIRKTQDANATGTRSKQQGCEGLCLFHETSATLLSDFQLAPRLSTYHTAPPQWLVWPIFVCCTFLRHQNLYSCKVLCRSSWTLLEPLAQPFSYSSLSRSLAAITSSMSATQYFDTVRVKSGLISWVGSKMGWMC